MDTATLKINRDNVRLKTENLALRTRVTLMENKLFNAIKISNQLEETLNAFESRPNVPYLNLKGFFDKVEGFLNEEIKHSHQGLYLSHESIGKLRELFPPTIN